MRLFVAGEGVIGDAVLEKGVDLGGSGGNAGGVRSGCDAGGARYVDGGFGRPDYGCYDYRSGGPGRWCSDSGFPDCSWYDSSLTGCWGRALLLALALSFCLVGWTDVVWAAVPVLVKVVPDSIVAGSQGVSLSIQGTGLDVGTAVHWGVTELVTTVYGDTSAVAVVPDSLVADVGGGVVSLVNVDGASNTIGIPVVDSIAHQLEPVLYVAAGLLGAMAFIWGLGTRWS